MADRANIKIVDHDSTVYLYTNNTGTNLPVTLQKALIRGESRLDDGPYLARIIFSEMIAEHVMDLTGFGISSTVTDGDERIITINIEGQTVQVGDDSIFPLAAYANWRSPRWLEPKRCPCCGSAGR